jgi:hypothetical protein
MRDQVARQKPEREIYRRRSSAGCVQGERVLTAHLSHTESGASTAVAGAWAPEYRLTNWGPLF